MIVCTTCHDAPYYTETLKQIQERHQPQHPVGSECPRRRVKRKRSQQRRLVRRETMIAQGESPPIEESWATALHTPSKHLVQCKSCSTLRTYRLRRKRPREFNRKKVTTAVMIWAWDDGKLYLLSAAGVTTSRCACNHAKPFTCDVTYSCDQARRSILRSTQPGRGTRKCHFIRPLMISVKGTCRPRTTANEGNDTGTPKTQPTSKQVHARTHQVDPVQASVGSTQYTDRHVRRDCMPTYRCRETYR